MKSIGLVLLFVFSFSAKADYLRFYLIRSPMGINWSTPWTFTMSAIKNQVGSYSISHVFSEIKCESTGKHIYRGMTSATDTEERELIFKKKYGLGVVFHTFKGHLEKDDELIEVVNNEFVGKKRRAELTFKISPATCERMVEYAEEYERLGYGNYYAGLDGDPLKREGAGCSAFAISFLRVGGLMESFTKEFQQHLDVPKKYIGGPLTGNKVDIISMITKPFARWSSKVPHIHLDAWDPELMHAWVKKTYTEVYNGKYPGPWPVEIGRQGNTYKVQLNLENRPTPAGDFWIDDV